MANSSAVENKEIKNKFIDHLEELFQQLFIHPNEILSFSAKLLELTDICSNLITENSDNASFACGIFNVILRNYIKLLDIDQFADGINHDDSIGNNNFLRQFFRIICRSDIQELLPQMIIKVRREIFFSLFDQINSSIRIISYLQNNLSNNNNNQILINSCGFILYTVLIISKYLRIKLTGNDLEKYQTNIFIPLITFLDEYFIQKENFRINEKQNDILIHEILCFICILTDKTLAIPIFINANCPQACLRWLALSYLDDYEYQCIVYILNNIARHDEGILILNKSNCIKIVRQFKNERMNIKFGSIISKEWGLKIDLVLDIILILVVDPDELYQEEDNNGTINQVLSLSQMISKCPNFKYKGYHISEILIALMKLCTNDNIIDYILQQDQYPRFFFITLKTFLINIENKELNDDDLDLDVLAIIALANILWSMSFNNQYKNALIQSISLIKKLEEFRENDLISYVLPHIYIPHQMSSLRRTIDGIWQNLYPPKVEIKSTIKTKTTYSVMISYSHINIPFCRQLYDILNTRPELSIWVDINNGKYLWKEIAQTIEQSDVVLFLLSKDFYYSKSCRQEFIYVRDILKKLFFPVFIDPDFKPTGWLHKRVARLRYIRFGEKDFMNTCDELLSMINENLSINISLIKTSFDVKQWTDKEIKLWFINNNIISELCEFYQFQNGYELLLYTQVTLAYSWTKEYERIKLRFEEKFKDREQNLSQDQFLKFIYALKRL